MSLQASGVISGVQTVENGPIQWSRELPHSCLLSQGQKISHKTENWSKLWVSFFLEFIHRLSLAFPTRYQETSHTNPSRPPWSQPPEDVDLREVFQRGKIATLYWSSCQHDHTVGDKPAGKEESICVLHEQVEPTASLSGSHPGISINLTCIVYQSHLFPAPWAPPAPTHRTDWCGAGQSDSSPQRNYISWNNKSSQEETHGRPCNYSGHIAEQASGIEHPGNLFPWDIRPAAGIKTFFLENLTTTTITDYLYKKNRSSCLPRTTILWNLEMTES